MTISSRTVREYIGTYGRDYICLQARKVDKYADQPETRPPTSSDLMSDEDNSYQDKDRAYHMWVVFRLGARLPKFVTRLSYVTAVMHAR